MLSKLVASLVSGQYDFYWIPLQLPTALIRKIPSLSKVYGDDEAFSAVKVTPGMSWVILECGQQINTGPPLSKQTFFESKFEVPYLKNPLPISSTELLTFKLLLQFSSRMMAIAATFVPGLSTTTEEYLVTAKRYEVVDKLIIEEIDSVDSSTNGSWSEADMMAQVQGWWIGSNTGTNATKFNFKLLKPSTRKTFKSSINLPAYLGMSIEEVEAFVKTKEGWYETISEGFDLSVATTMEVTKLSTL